MKIPTCGSSRHNPLPMQTYIRRTLLIAVMLLGIAVTFLWHRSNHLKQERDRYRSNTEALLSDMQRMQVDSSTMAVDVKSLRLAVDEYKRYRAEDAELIKKMGIKIKSLEAAARHQIEVNARIKAPVRDSVITRDTLLVQVQAIEMVTPHIEFRGVIEDNTLTADIHLPVTLHQAVWIEYKRRWLFWKKAKAVHQTISSDNPHVEITYSEYIRIEK